MDSSSLDGNARIEVKIHPSDDTVKCVSFAVASRDNKSSTTDNNVDDGYGVTRASGLGGISRTNLARPNNSSVMSSSLGDLKPHGSRVAISRTKDREDPLIAVSRRHSSYEVVRHGPGKTSVVKHGDTVIPILSETSAPQSSPSASYFDMGIDEPTTIKSPVSQGIIIPLSIDKKLFRSTKALKTLAEPLVASLGGEAYSRRKSVKDAILSGLHPGAEEVEAATKRSIKLGPLHVADIQVGGRSLMSMNQYRNAYRTIRANDREPQVIGSLFRWLIFFLDFDVLKEKLSIFFGSANVRVFFLFLGLIVDIVFSSLYLVELQKMQPIYSLKPYWLFIERSYPYWVTLSSFALFNVFTQILSIFFQEFRRESFLNLNTFLNVITVTPFAISFFLESGQYLYSPYFLRLWIIIPRLRSVMRLNPNADILFSRLVIFISFIVSIIFTAMCCFNYCELMFPPGNAAPRKYDIVDSLYFIVITISTVGYGEITPKSIPGRIVVIVLILVALSVVPGLISGIAETAKLRKFGGGNAPRTGGNYVVVFGVFDNTTRLRDILNSFINSESQDMSLVFMGRGKPPNLVKALINSPAFQSKVTLLMGTGLEESDLVRSRIRGAKAVFILPDINCADARQEDEQNTLLTWTIEDHDETVPIYMYNLLPFTESYVSNIATTACADDLKQVILAYTCLYKGSATFLLNLLIHYKPAERYNTAFEAQYGDGLGNEIYSERINPIFVGHSFASLSWYLYREFQVILFAVNVFRESTGDYVLVLNPGNKYRLKFNDIGVYISQSRDDIHTITRLDVESYLASERLHGKTSNPSLGRHSTSSLEDFFAGIDDSVQIGKPQGAFDGEVPLCHLLKTPTTIDDAVRQDFTELTKHVLVLTDTFDWFKFVCTMRSAQITRHDFRTIVFLASRAPNESEFQYFRIFPKVYFMKGDYRSKRDLTRAGIYGADKVVVVPGVGFARDDDMVDSKAIMTSALIHEMFAEMGKQKYIVVSLEKRFNIKFVRPNRKAISKQHKKATSQRFHSDVAAAYGTYDYLYAPTYASGRVLVNAMFSTILFQTFLNSAILDVVKLFCGIRYERTVQAYKDLKVDPSHLCYVDCPVEFVGNTFGDLYETFSVQNGIIPLGLLRPAGDFKESGNILPYVYTNPLRSILLKEHDLVFVLKSGKD